MERNVSITGSGRSGQVVYREAAGELSFYWEFGGGDVVASVQVGTETEWRTKHLWAAERRSEILRFLAAELVRQKAPSCRAEIDERRGWINLRQPPVGNSMSATQVSAAHGAASRAATPESPSLDFAGCACSWRSASGSPPSSSGAARG